MDWKMLRKVGVLLAVTAAALAAEPVSSEPVRDSRWWSQVDLIDASLHNGRWKYARRRAIKLTETILEESWRDRELNEVLAELALYRAVADANLDRRDDAIWYWQLALNLDRDVAKRDLSTYGAAATSLSEVPLRKKGTIPPRFLEEGPGTTAPVAPPGFPDVSPPILINNAGGSRQRADDFEVEVILDHRGGLHDPVVLSRHVNPVVIYACLEWLHGIPSLEPALQDGQPVATTYTILIEFKVSAYPGALVLNEEDPE